MSSGMFLRSLALFLGAVVVAHGQALPLTLTNVAAVRALAASAAAKELPVALEGVVTFADAPAKNFFLQDATGGIFVRGWQPGLQAGRLVSVTGRTQAGGVGRVLLLTTATDRGPGAFPEPVQAEAAQLMSGQLDAQWVEVAGVPRSVTVQPLSTTLRIATLAGVFEAIITRRATTNSLQYLVNSEVRLRGVCGAVPGVAGGAGTVQLRLPGFTNLTLSVRAPTNNFTLERQSAAHITTNRLAQIGLHRVRVQGVATLVEGTAEFYLQDASGAVRVFSVLPNAITPGRSAEVVGFAGSDGTRSHLEEAVFRYVPDEPKVVPQPTEVAHLLTVGTAPRQLVTVEGQLLNPVGGALNPVLLLQSGTTLFQAHVANALAAGPCPDWQLGARYQLTGVAELQQVTGGRARSLVLTVRNFDDVKQVAAPPRWSQQQVLAVAGGLGVSLVAAGAWLALLRRQVRRQSGQIRATLEAEAAVGQRLALVWESAQDPMVMTDASGVIASANPAFAKLVGRDRAQLEGQPFTTVFKFPDPEAVLRDYQMQFRDRLVAGRQALEVTLWNDRRLWLDASCAFYEHPGQPVLVLNQYRDDTARHQATLALELHQRRLDGIVNSTQDAILVLDEDNRVAFCNRMAEEMFRVGAHGFPPAPVDALLPVGNWREDLETLAGGGGLTVGKPARRSVSAARSDGETFPAELGLCRIHVAGQNLLTVTCRDLTAVQQAERERRQLEAQLNQAQKMEAIGVLAGGIAHDFNNILAVILGNVSLAALDLPAEHPAVHSLKEVETASHRARDLVQQILDFARRQRRQLAVQDLAPVVEEGLRFLRATIPAGVAFVVRLGTGVPTVRADPAQVQRVLLNLVTNAWHALENRADGRITIELSAECVPAGTPPPQPGLLPSNYARLRVADNGKGMDAATAQHMFDPFFTTKEPGQGTGLGLAAVHGIMADHDGKIFVASALGMGTTLDLYFPECSTPSPAAPAPPPLADSHGEHLLLVDDEPAVIKTLTRILAKRGFQVTAFTDPEAASRAFAEAPGRFDLVITDFNMPGVSGIELTRRLRSQSPHVPILMCSGYLDDGTIELAERHGVTKLLNKPVPMDELLHTIAELLTTRPARPPG